MPDENKTIEATAGPYKGQRLTMPAADADQAIADGWARDPFAPAPGPDDKPAKEPTDEERQAVMDKAEKAAKKLRGETVEEESHDKTRETREQNRDRKPASEDKAMGAEGSHTYETRRTAQPAPAQQQPKKR